jgi:hypothetical protein
MKGKKEGMDGSCVRRCCYVGVRGKEGEKRERKSKKKIKKRLLLVSYYK